MICQMGFMRLSSPLQILNNRSSQRSYLFLGCLPIIQSWFIHPRCSGKTDKVFLQSSAFAQSVIKFLRHDHHEFVVLYFESSETQIRARWKVVCALDNGGFSANGEQETLSNASPSLGGTRLGRIVSSGGRKLLTKLNSARKNLPMKIFLLLLGFYTANALATILGQTGDWDVLVAGVVVAAIEGIGMLMYRNPPSKSTARFQSFITMINYWKAGVCLGLFVDAFKLGS